MQTARRLYVYLISGVSLGVLVTGASMLLGVALEQVGLGPIVDDRGQTTGERLTLATALVVVAVPVWLIHWFVAERSVRPDASEGAVERTSTVRGLYFALAMGGLLLALASGAGASIRLGIQVAAGTEIWEGSSVADGIALAVAAGLAWLYHALVRERDWRHGPMTGGGAWLPRAYVLIAAFVGLMAMLNGFADLLATAWAWQGATGGPGARDPWLAYSAGEQLASVLVGGAVWIGHAWHADRVARDVGWRGDSERPARLRQAYPVAVVVAALAWLVVHLSTAAGNAIRWLVDQLQPMDPVSGIGIPLAAAIPFALAAWLHGRRGRREALASGSEARLGVAERLELYPVALVGLAAAAVGAVRLGAGLIEGLFGPSPRLGDAWLWGTIADGLPLALLGLATWLWAWRGVGHRVASDSAGEARSTIRRAALLIALAASVLAGIGGAALVLYRLFGGLFGVELSGEPVSELSTPIATLVVAIATATYHALALRRDLALDAPAPGGEVVAPGVTASVGLRLLAPPGSDVEAAIGTLRSHLPPGFELEIGDPPPEA